MAEIHTDCRDESGTTTGLIDALIAICRILAGRDLSSPAATEALLDLRCDEDVNFIMGKGRAANE